MFAASSLLGEAEQAFHWLQEFAGFFILVVVTPFVLGMFWKRATAAGAFAAAIGSAVCSLVLKLYLTAAWTSPRTQHYAVHESRRMRIRSLHDDSKVRFPLAWRQKFSKGQFIMKKSTSKPAQGSISSQRKLQGF